MALLLRLSEELFIPHLFPRGFQITYNENVHEEDKIDTKRGKIIKHIQEGRLFYQEPEGKGLLLGKKCD